MRDIARLFRLFVQPAAAMGEILDQSSLLFATSAVVAVSVLLDFSVTQRGFSIWSALLPLFALAVVYVPSTLLLTTLIARLGGVSAVFERDFSPLFTCTAMAWAAINLPVVAAGWILPFEITRIVMVAAYLYFLVLMIFVVRTVFGTETRVAVGVVSVSWIPVFGAAFLVGPLSFILRFLTSPFLLFFAFYYLRNEFAGLGKGLRDRQHFHRMLEAAAINPHDGDAQYQLGLIYQQRRQYTEAIRRFELAVKIDPDETDAHFQLGRIALAQNRLEDALAHFETVFALDPKHTSSEILRELGAVYLAQGRLPEALRFLHDYVERRPYDPEGLYYYGSALEKTGDSARAREAFLQAMEADRTAPRYRRRYTAQWSRLAQKQLRQVGRQPVSPVGK